MGLLPLPEPDVHPDEALVRRLLDAQHPDLAELPFGERYEGWDNTTFRLGHQLAVRLPRRAIAVPLLHNELQWLPELSWRWPFEAPVPLRRGGANADFPYPWAVVRWVDGADALQAPMHHSAAAGFGAAIRTIHVACPEQAPLNPHRGVPLIERSQLFEQRLSRLDAEMPDALDAGAVAHRWAKAVNTPIDLPPAWIHGDLHPRNLVVREGQLAGIIDWGDLGRGDPATDLGMAWFSFDAPQVEQVFVGYGGVSEATRLRAEGNALAIAVSIANMADPLAPLGLRVIERLGLGPTL